MPGVAPVQAADAPLPMPLLSMSGVHKQFGQTHALKGVSLQLAGGEVLALIGENGAGKSTLMKVLSGAIQPDVGTMVLDGKPYHPRNPLDARRAGVAMIYQELSIAPDLTVMENILLGVEPGLGPLVDWREMRRRAAAALREVGRDDIDPGTRARNLSVGEQQIVEIARSMVLGCRVLVLDEPTSSLSRRDILALFDLLRRLRASGMGIIYISHFLEEVRTISDRFTVLRDGASVGGGRTRDVADPEIIRMMVGRNVDELYPRSRHVAGDTVLSVSNLVGRKKPARASLELRRGEVLGIAGLVGAGRTELLRCIFGLDKVRRGEIRVEQWSGVAGPHRRWEQGVGFVSEDRKSEGLALGLSIADNVTLSNLDDLGPFGLVLPKRQDAATRPWIDKLSIRCRSPRQRVRDLSGGNQQKVAVARLLHHGVDVLLLDEPTRGVDIGAKAQIYRLINELASGDPARQRLPAAVLMVSSYLPELLGVCDRIAVMSRGVLGDARPVSDWNEHSLMAEAIGQSENET
jgi:ribose transport system ATP-binding protein